MMLVLQHPFLGPSRAAAFLAADLLYLLLLRASLAQQFVLDLIGQKTAGQKAVHDLGTLLLALDLDASGAVFQVDAGGGLVDVLAAVAARADEVLLDVALLDAQGAHAVFQSFLFEGVYA